MGHQEHLQDRVYAAAIRDPESFWTRHAEQLSWHQKPSRALATRTRQLRSGAAHEHWSWFPDGEINTTYNCVDRHVEKGNGDVVAISWDSPVTGKKDKITYRKLLEEVETLAGVLREEGVGKGDVVLIYMPMIPQAIYAMLATARLGAVHAVVFGGFASASLAQRIDSCNPKIVMTASCGIEGSKGPLGYQKLLLGAYEKSKHTPPRTIIWQRDELKWEPVQEENGERNWQTLVSSARDRNIKADPVPVKSSDPLYIIYTSGTTGLPKGVLREAGGHAVGMSLSIKYMMGIHGPGDVMFCASDVGWVVGHSYIVYGPLLAGATTVLFEGKPVGTPNASSFWRIVEENKATVMYTAPTALRAIRREDGDNDYFVERGERGGLKSLRAIFLAGERSEPSIVQMYQDLLGKYCAPDACVVDNWWSSESGSPITGLALSAPAGLDYHSNERIKPLPIRPGSAGKPLPGFDVRVVNDEGHELARGQMGNIVMAIPLAPTSFTTLWQDDERFYRGYLKRFDGRWVDTGDAGMMDADGYVHIMARTDDIINVAAHRFSTGAIEQVITSHPAVAEAAVVGIPDALKGHLPFAFITLAGHAHPDHPHPPAVPSAQLHAEIQHRIRTQIGAIACLGGIVQGRGIIPKTRSGKSLRRVLRALLEHAVRGEFDRPVEVPGTIEDPAAVAMARRKVREYFLLHAGAERHRPVEEGGVRARL